VQGDLMLAATDVKDLDLVNAQFGEVILQCGHSGREFLGEKKNTPMVSRSFF
jgi:hypothetical protein